MANNDLFDEEFLNKNPRFKYATKKLIGKDLAVANFKTFLKGPWDHNRKLVYIRENYRKAFVSAVRRLTIGEWVEDGLIKDSFKGMGTEEFINGDLEMQFETFYKGLLIQSNDSGEYDYYWLKNHDAKKFLKLAPYMMTPARNKDIIKSEWYKNLPEE